jgi:hypothetical protein
VPIATTDHSSDGRLCPSLLYFHCSDTVVATGQLSMATVAYSLLLQCLFVVVLDAGKTSVHLPSISPEQTGEILIGTLWIFLLCIQILKVRSQTVLSFLEQLFCRSVISDSNYLCCFVCVSVNGEYFHLP